MPIRPINQAPDYVCVCYVCGQEFDGYSPREYLCGGQPCRDEHGRRVREGLARRRNPPPESVSTSPVTDDDIRVFLEEAVAKKDLEYEALCLRALGETTDRPGTWLADLIARGVTPEQARDRIEYLIRRGRRP